jgi:hypothetical protein
MVAGWYPSVTPLTNGEMLITEGGPDIPEVRKTDGSLRTLSTASLNLPLYPWLDVATDGRAFYSGPDQTLRSLNTSGGAPGRASASVTRSTALTAATPSTTLARRSWPAAARRRTTRA